MKAKKGHFFESTTIEDVLLKVEKYGETGEVNRVFIGDVEVTGLLQYVYDHEDFFGSLETIPEMDVDAIYEREHDK